MKKIKRSIFKNFFINIEKEEAWLNEMCKKGYALIEISKGFYLFEDCALGNFIYRIAFLKKSASKNDNLALNVKHIASTNRWHYYRKDAALGKFTIYSDIDSQIEHYQRINFIWYILAIIFLYSGLQDIFQRDKPTFIILLNTGLIVIGILFLIVGFPFTKKIYILKRKKNLPL